MSLVQEPVVGVFGPDAIRNLNCAYRSALDILNRQPLLKRGMADQDARVQLAKVLMDLARAGEADAAGLREKALIRLSLIAEGPDARRKAA